MAAPTTYTLVTTDDHLTHDSVRVILPQHQISDRVHKAREEILESQQQSSYSKNDTKHKNLQQIKCERQRISHGWKPGNLISKTKDFVSNV